MGENAIFVINMKTVSETTEYITVSPSPFPVSEAESASRP
jgi:hypothetical protein